MMTPMPTVMAPVSAMMVLSEGRRRNGERYRNRRQFFCFVRWKNSNLLPSDQRAIGAGFSG
jgi:hypothetical protein